MKKKWLIVALFIVVVTGCKEISPVQKQREIKRAEFAATEYAAAAKRADNNDPVGYLKLYEIARDDDNIYTTDYSEVAEEKLFLLLYSHPELWLKTFSKVDLKKFKDFVKGIEVSRSARPEGVSNERFRETILKNLEKIKGDKREMELVDYILGLYGRKRR
jgi:hypothetical protein